MALLGYFSYHIMPRPGFKPTSVELHQPGTFRRKLYRRSYCAAGIFLAFHSLTLIGHFNPFDQIEHILLSTRTLGASDFINFSTTCRRFRSFFYRSAAIWKTLFSTNFPEISGFVRLHCLFSNKVRPLYLNYSVQSRASTIKVHGYPFSRKRRKNKSCCTINHMASEVLGFKF